MKYTHTWPATLSSISSVQTTITDILKPHNIPDKTMMHVELVIEEVVANIVHYAYLESGEGSFLVETILGQSNLTITFVDDGPPFDPTQSETPDTSGGPEGRRIGGLGIFMVKKLSESVEYKRLNDANHLKITLTFD